MITTNVLHRVFVLIVQAEQGTGFTIEVDNKQYIITAKHLAKNIKKKDSVKIIHQNKEKLIKTVLVGHCDGENDISVLSTNFQISPSYTMKPSDAGLIYGQNVYFLGFPYLDVKDTSKINRGFPVPFVKKAITSNINIKEGKAIFYLDGHNNPGFSGGPVIFKPTGKKDYQVAAVISGYRSQLDKIIYQDKKGKKIPTELRYESNTGIIISYGIKCAVNLIKNNPIGFPLNN